MTQGINPIDGMTVELADHGQDFLEFDIKGGSIVATRPCQGWHWNGHVVINDEIAVGDHIAIHTTSGVRTFNYPVIAVRPLTTPIGPTDV